MAGSTMKPQLPCRICADLADAVVAAPTHKDALQALCSAVLQAVLSECVVFVKTPSGWARTSGRVTPARELAWRQSLERLAHLRANGDSDHAFGWADLPEATALMERRCA